MPLFAYVFFESLFKRRRNKQKKETNFNFWEADTFGVQHMFKFPLPLS